MSRMRYDNDPVKLSADPYLEPFLPVLEQRALTVSAEEDRLTGGRIPLKEAAIGHTCYGLHRTENGWKFREWAPNATELFLVGDFSNGEIRPEWACKRLNEYGDWELQVPQDAIRHGMHGKLFVRWNGGEGFRLPAYARYVVQDANTGIFTFQVWEPETPYAFRNPIPPRPEEMLIYEAHIGMAQEEGKVGTFREFRENVLPAIARSGYNTIQLMAVMSHP